jgi:Stage II sporulation protein E (SpoIIE)
VSGTPPRAGSSSSPPLFQTLSDDFQVVAEDIRRRGVKRAIGGTLASLESFYLTDEDRRQLAAMKGARRLLRRLGWFIKSLLMKLTPARRIMLAAAIVTLVLGLQRIDIRTFHVSLRFPLLGTLLVFAVLILELKDKLMARDELEAGRKVQLALMPSATPQVPGWAVWLYTQPANDVGGDLVDHLQIDERRHFVALGDVSGKALPAALLSVKLQATLRALAPNFDDLGDLGAAVNFILQRDGLPSRFASLVYLLLTTDSGCVRVLNAGHMPPLIVRNNKVTSMDRGSVVLGIMPNATFSEQVIELNTGDTVIVYSDGVSEAMNEADDFFGEERLYAIAQQTSGQPIDAIGARILAGVANFVGHAAVSDDVSLMVLRRR